MNQDDEESDKDGCGAHNSGTSETAKAQKKPMSMKAAIDSYKLDHKKGALTVQKRSGNWPHHEHDATLTEKVIQPTPSQRWCLAPMCKWFLLTVNDVFTY